MYVSVCVCVCVCVWWLTFNILQSYTSYTRIFPVMCLKSPLNQIHNIE